MPPRKILVLGADGQLGKALRREYADQSSVEFASRADFDVMNPDAYSSREWRDYSAIINAAAYTAVDQAETAVGRRAAWSINVTAVAELAKVASFHRLTLVHISSDYVFDGTNDIHPEDEPFSPLGVYGQTKAAGDAVVSVVPRHYIVRTSWVIGDGHNFAATMAALAVRGVKPSVVSDQTGRLTFAAGLASGIRHLLDTGAEYGTYNLTSDGPPRSWADIAREVYGLTGYRPDDVVGVSAAEYYAGKEASPRPASSILDLLRIKSAGFQPQDGTEGLRRYLEGPQ